MGQRGGLEKYQILMTFPETCALDSPELDGSVLIIPRFH